MRRLTANGESLRQRRKSGTAICRYVERFTLSPASQGSVCGQAHPLDEPARSVNDAPVKLAFAIVSLFNWGGLQRDCMRLARAATAAGHEVQIFTARAAGALPPDLNIEILPVAAITNHGRNRRFAEALRRAAAGRFDRVVGFDKIPGLDVLYCGDLCFADRRRGFLSRFNPRVRGMLALEESCFGRSSQTRVLALAEPQIAAYRRAWGTPAERIVLLPPQIDPARRHPDFRKDGTRERVRAALGLGADLGADFGADALVLLAVGAWPHRKGYDRVVAALPELPGAIFLVCGAAPQSREGAALIKQARDLKVGDRLMLLGSRDDVTEIMSAADLFVHPARSETTGTAILEAIVNGLPVVATEVCGFSPHIRAADAGRVISEPFTMQEFVDALRLAAAPTPRATWSANAARYGEKADLYSGIDRALQEILDSQR